MRCNSFLPAASLFAAVAAAGWPPGLLLACPIAGPGNGAGALPGRRHGALRRRPVPRRAPRGSARRRRRRAAAGGARLALAARTSPSCSSRLAAASRRCAQRRSSPAPLPARAAATRDRAAARRAAFARFLAVHRAPSVEPRAVGIPPRAEPLLPLRRTRRVALPHQSADPFDAAYRHAVALLETCRGRP